MSNKTPIEPQNETASGPKNPIGLWLGAGLILFGLFAVVQGIIGLTDNKLRLVAPNGNIIIEVVDSPETRQQGLSGRENISDTEGMMFVFDETNIDNCFWMKDMKFSIDMIWLDVDKKVVTVTENVSPDTYPTKFCPDQPANYGLEVGAGRAEVLGITEQELLRW